MPAPLTAACVAVSALMLHVAEPTLWSILKAEGGRVGACVTQANGSHDCGPAQINAETWVPRLSALLHRTPEDVHTELRDDGCFNVWAAAYVLRVKLAEAGGDAWDAAGRYNSATPRYKLAYQARLIDAYDQLFHRPRPGPGSAR